MQSKAYSERKGTNVDSNECFNCGVRLGEDSADYCPSCEISYGLVAVKRPACPEWLWRGYCALYRAWPWLGRTTEPIFASRNPAVVKAAIEQHRAATEQDATGEGV